MHTHHSSVEQPPQQQQRDDIVVHSEQESLQIEPKVVIKWKSLLGQEAKELLQSCKFIEPSMVKSLGPSYYKPKDDILFKKNKAAIWSQS